MNKWEQSTPPPFFRVHLNNNKNAQFLPIVTHFSLSLLASKYSSLFPHINLQQQKNYILFQKMCRYTSRNYCVPVCGYSFSINATVLTARRFIQNVLTINHARMHRSHTQTNLRRPVNSIVGLSKSTEILLNKGPLESCIFHFSPTQCELAWRAYRSRHSTVGHDFIWKNSPRSMWVVLVTFGHFAILSRCAMRPTHRR